MSDDRFITVKKAAKSLGVSTRRVRALLAQGRIRGYKSEGIKLDGANRSRWVVLWPLDVLPGKRGPDLKHFPVRHVYSSPEPRSGARQCRDIADSKKTAPVAADSARSCRADAAA